MKFSPEILIHDLKPAGFFLLEDSGVIKTILGSCITVTMFNRRTGKAAACHPVLPECRIGDICNRRDCRDKYKYVDCIIPEMARLFQKSKIRPEEIEVKMFGGAELIYNTFVETRPIQVGRANIAMARKKLTEHGFEITSFDVGGPIGRKLFFDTATGNVWVKLLHGEPIHSPGEKVMKKQPRLQFNGQK